MNEVRQEGEDQNGHLPREQQPCPDHDQPIAPFRAIAGFVRLEATATVCRRVVGLISAIPRGW
jgi:hypothetical protein